MVHNMTHEDCTALCHSESDTKIEIECILGCFKSSDHVTGHVAVKIITTHVVGHHQIMSCAWGRGRGAMAVNIEKSKS